MRTKTFTIKNPSRGVPSYSNTETPKPVSASVEIEVVCDSDADQIRALLALDEIWKKLFIDLQAFTVNPPLPASTLE